jgi:hypothetical protein
LVSELTQQAKSSLFDLSHGGPFCDVTLTLKQARQADNGAWVKIDECECKRAFRLFMNRLDQAVYGNAVRRYKKRLRVTCLGKRRSSLSSVAAIVFLKISFASIGLFTHLLRDFVVHNIVT